MILLQCFEQEKRTTLASGLLGHLCVASHSAARLFAKDATFHRNPRTRSLRRLDETYQKTIRLGFTYVLGTMDAMMGLASSLVISLGDRLSP